MKTFSVEEMLLKKLKELNKEIIKCEINNIDNYKTLPEWKLLNSNKDLLWTIIQDAYPEKFEDITLLKETFNNL